jgi:hypothetical protein
MSPNQVLPVQSKRSNLNMRDPIIVMGMHKSGTTLVTEMIHKGGIPMFTGDADPSYDNGLKYERPICHDMNLHALGLQKRSRPLDPIWKYPVKSLLAEDLSKLAEEVGDQPWGFKDPRTTFTYSAWLEKFPKGPRIYVYRSHKEILHRFCSGKRRYLRNAAKALQAWLHYNEKTLENFQLDQKEGRPAALVNYEELMTHPSLLGRLEQVLGIRFHDARDPRLHRNKVQSRWEDFSLGFLTLGCSKRLSRVNAELEARRLAP